MKEKREVIDLIGKISERQETRVSKTFREFREEAEGGVLVL